MTAPASTTQLSDSEMANVLDAFKDFCRLRSSRKIRETTLTSYTNKLLVLFRSHGLSLHGIDLGELERVIKERIKSRTNADTVAVAKVQTAIQHSACAYRSTQHTRTPTPEL